VNETKSKSRERGFQNRIFISCISEPPLARPSGRAALLAQEGAASNWVPLRGYLNVSAKFLVPSAAKKLMEFAKRNAAGLEESSSVLGRLRPRMT
jgi:hypothetical protein